MRLYRFVNSSLETNILDDQNKVRVYKTIDVCARDEIQAREKMKANLAKDQIHDHWQVSQTYQLSKDWR